jgi:hypothetical protein
VIATVIRPGRVTRQRARAAARAVGCTCRPDLELVRSYGDGAQHVVAIHDADCPAADRGRTVSLWPNARAA